MKLTVGRGRSVAEPSVAQEREGFGVVSACGRPSATVGAREV